MTSSCFKAKQLWFSAIQSFEKLLLKAILYEEAATNSLSQIIHFLNINSGESSLISHNHSLWKYPGKHISIIILFKRNQSNQQIDSPPRPKIHSISLILTQFPPHSVMFHLILLIVQNKPLPADSHLFFYPQPTQNQGYLFVLSQLCL